MKSMKKLLLSVLAIATLVMCFALTSCGGECEHVWGEWTANGEATCSGTAEKRVCSECEEVETRTNGDAKAHTWGAWTVKTAAGCITAGEEGRACTKCSVTETRPIAATGHEGDVFCENCAGMIFTFPEVDFSAYDSVAIDLKDFELTMIDPEDSTNSGTLTLGVTEGYVKLDENGELIGAFKANVIMNGEVANASTTYLINGLIEGGFIYVGTEGSQPNPATNIKENRYVRFSLSTASDMDEMQDALEQAEALLPEIEAWYADFAELFADVAIDASGVKNFAIDLLNGMFVKTATTDGYTITVDYEAIKAFNAKLAEKTIAEMFDVIAGEGAYADVKAFITSDEFFALSVADLISYIETEQGIDLAEFFASIDELLLIGVQGPAPETSPLLGLLASNGLALPEGFDTIEDFLRDDSMAEYSVLSALSMMISVADDPATAENETVEAFKEMLAPIFAQLEESTVYEVLLASGANNEQAGSAPLSDEDEDPIAAMVEMVNGMIDEMAEMSGITIYFDKNGAFVKTVLTVTAAMPTGEMEATITVTDEDVTVDYAYAAEMESMQGASNGTMTIVPGEAVTSDAAAIARIKAAIAKIPMAKQDYFNAILGELFHSDSDVYKIQGNTLTILRLININSTTIDVAVFQFEYNENYSITVIEGCTNFYEVEMTVDGKSAKGSAPIIGEVYWDYLVDEYFVDATNFQNIVNSVPAEAWGDESTEVDFSYNAAATENKYDYADNRDYDDWYGQEMPEIRIAGHIYVLDESKSVFGEDCGDILKYAYKCSKCNDEYVYYTIVEHYSVDSYILADEDLGLAGGFVKVQDCVNCEEVDAFDYVIYINSELDAAYQDYNNNDYAYIVITVGAEDVGTYNFYTVAEEDDYCDTYVTIYKWDSVNEDMDEHITENDDALPYNHCFATANLEEGTYLVCIRTLSSVNVDSFTFVIAAAE